MTYQWASASRAALATAHPALQRLADRALELAPFDLAAREGHRTREEHEALPPGATQVAWEDSKHSRMPSWAIHLEPLPIRYEDDRRYYVLAGVVGVAARELGLEDALRWGGDWDRDLDLLEETFRDLAHWELIADVEAKPMGNPVFNLSSLFGGKPWYKSMTAWGALLLLLGVEFVDGARAVGVLDPDVLDVAEAWITKIGAVLGMLGIRRRLPS